MTAGTDRAIRILLRRRDLVAGSLLSATISASFLGAGLVGLVPLLVLLLEEESSLSGLLNDWVPTLERWSIPTEWCELLINELPTNRFWSFVLAASFLCASQVINSLARYIQSRFSHLAVENALATWRAELFSSILRSDLSLAGQIGSSGGVTRMVHDVQELEAGYTALVGKAPFRALRGLVGLATAALLSWPLVVLGAIAGPIAAWLTQQISRRVRKASREVSSGTGVLVRAVEEVFDNRDLIIAHGLERTLTDRFQKENALLKSRRIDRALSAALGAPALELLNVVSFSLIACGAAWYLFEAGQPAAQSIAALIALAAAARHFEMLLRSLPRISRSLEAAQRLEAVCGRPPARRTESEDALPSHRLEIRLQDVVYRYPTSPGAALDSVSITLPFGQVVALVGPNGSGKSTLLRALAGILELQSEAYYLDGVALTRDSLPALRRQIALVPEEPLLFAGSVKDNLVLGREQVSEAELAEVMAVTRLNAFRGSTPVTLASRISEDGSGLSAGQRQRLSLARALLRDPSILLMDEPSGHLDAASLEDLLACLGKIRGTRTIVIATHRKHIMRVADQIALMQGGKLVAYGNHRDLMRSSLAYRRWAENDPDEWSPSALIR